MTGRMFVLLEWHPVLGMTAAPVGVLGIETDTGEVRVSWVPPVLPSTGAWRSRLAALPALARIEGWLAEDGAVQLEEVPAPAGADSLADAAETVLDALLAEVIPRLPGAR